MRRKFATAFLVATALALTSACEDITDPPKAPDPVKFPGLTSVSAPAEAPGDGATLVRIQATVDTSLTGETRVVKFTTTAGTFSDKTEITVRADSAGLAIAQLRAPSDSVTALIIATAGSTARRVEVRFTAALAERVDLDPSSFSVEAGASEEIDLTATLRRTRGTPSPGSRVSFAAQDSTGAPIGRFSSAPPSNATGTVVTRFSPGDTSYRGAVTITATTSGISGPIAGTTTVVITSPR